MRPRGLRRGARPPTHGAGELARSKLGVRPRAAQFFCDGCCEGLPARAASGMPPARPPGSTSEPAVGARARRGVGAAARAAARALAANIRPATHTRASNSRAYATTWQRGRDAARQRSATRPWVPLRVAAGLSRRQAAATRESRQQTAKKKKRERPAQRDRTVTGRGQHARCSPPFTCPSTAARGAKALSKGGPVDLPSPSARVRAAIGRGRPPARARSLALAHAWARAAGHFQINAAQTKTTTKTLAAIDNESARRIGHPWVR